MCVHMDANRTLSQLSYGPKNSLDKQPRIYRLADSA